MPPGREPPQANEPSFIRPEQRDPPVRPTTQGKSTLAGTFPGQSDHTIRGVPIHPALARSDNLLPPHYLRYNPQAISSAIRISLSLASGVRNALCADSVTLGSVVSLCPAGSGSVLNTSSAA